MFSINNGPFLEENDVSRRVGKPIYVEDQVNDGQTQRTGQAMVPCTTVRTEYTASASIEGKLNISDSISSKPSEMQTHNNIFTLPITQPSLLSMFLNTLYLISTTYLNLSSEDSDNDNISPTTCTILGKPPTSLPSNLLEIYDTSTCFNKFLLYYKLQLLPSLQTITLFLSYIQTTYPSFFSEQFIKISIKQNETDNNNNEAYIYLPNKTTLLQNYFMSPFKNLLAFSNTSLKSDYTISIQIPSLQSCESSLNAFPNQFNSPSDPIPEYISLPINIASLNINGLSQSNKKLSIIEMLNTNTFDILGLSETHASIKEGKFLNNQIPNYTSY